MTAIPVTAPADSTPDPAAVSEFVRMAEALLFAASEPLDEESISARLPDGADVPAILAQLVAEYQSRGVNLVQVAGKWQFRTAADLKHLLERHITQTRRMSRAAVETLAIIAYHQPVTRADVEDIRGVSLSAGSLEVLLEAGWVVPKGRRKTPGRPVVYGTSETFLEHFGLESMADLPGIDELKATGLLQREPPGPPVRETAGAGQGGSSSEAEEAEESDDDSGENNPGRSDSVVPLKPR
ncbi:MAG: SMC-Scp complex subunit ScpB [Alphaproteobacteria bacterium]|nr:SMC-Scp complex subunit ScpB [Alphaproteobacteria bacterium]